VRCGQGTSWRPPGLITPSQNKATGRPRGSGGRAEELSLAEIRRVNRRLAGTRHELRNRALLYLGLGCGMRIDELVGLKMSDVAPHGHLLSRVVLEKHSTKSKRSRTVSVSKQALAHLKCYLDKRSPEPGPDDALFASGGTHSRSLNPAYAAQLVKQMLRNAGIANASSHSLRRTHANNLRRLGADLMIIKNQLGHASLATTQRYLTADPAETQRAVDRLKF
jgi:integrase/recombinase XerD